MPVGSVVTPPECAPPPIAARESAAARGDEDSGASLIVTLTRPAPSLRARVDQLAECSSFTGAVGGDAAQAAEVAVELPPAPPVDADDSYAVDQTVTSDPGVGGQSYADAGRPRRRRPGDRLLAAAGHVRNPSGQPGAGRPVHRCGAQGARPGSPVAGYPQSRLHPHRTVTAPRQATSRRSDQSPSGHDDIAIRFPAQPARRADRGVARRSGLRARKVPRSGDRRPRRDGLRYAR